LSIEDARPEKYKDLPSWPSKIGVCRNRHIEDSTWGRRLHSRWGPHWHCEEELGELEHETTSALMRSCKKL
jgi:hypothetical protein